MAQPGSSYARFVQIYCIVTRNVVSMLLQMAVSRTWLWKRYIRPV